MLVLLISLIVLTVKIAPGDLGCTRADNRICVVANLYLYWLDYCGYCSQYFCIFSKYKLERQLSFSQNMDNSLITVATVIYLLLIRFRNMREAALVGVWAFIAIAVKQWQGNQSIVIAAIAAAVILFIAVAVHGFKNRNTSPFKKIQRGEV